jgi:hypothetical protein
MYQLGNSCNDWSIHGPGEPQRSWILDVVQVISQQGSEEGISRPDGSRLWPTESPSSIWSWLSSIGQRAIPRTIEYSVHCGGGGPAGRGSRRALFMVEGQPVT